MTGFTGRGVRGVVGIVCVLSAFGCGGQNNGPPRYRVSGTVTFDNQPIPAGVIVFSPDLAKKNDGPQGMAEIRDGQFDTGWGEGKGVVGGPMLITVGGTAAPDGKPLCRYEFTADLPRENTTRNIVVPKSAAVKAGKFESP